MRVNGREIKPRTRPVVIGIQQDDETHQSEVVVQVSGYPFGFHNHLEEQLPSPSKPSAGVARDEDGNVIRGTDGQAVPKYDLQDPEYRKRLEKIDRLQQAVLIREALSADDSIEWDTDPTDYDLPKDYEDYAEDLAQEIETTLPPGATVRILQAANKLSGVTPDELEEAAANFRGAG